MVSIAHDLRSDCSISASPSPCRVSLARQFASGATMWCIAPEWPEHARHVAVEFVHPVLVGKRALPASALNRPTRLLHSDRSFGRATLCWRSAAASRRQPREIMRRAEAWGATTIWMGVGAEPAERAADHIVWIDRKRARQPCISRWSTGAAVSRAVGVDPRLLRAPWTAHRRTSDCDDDVCITCSDEGRLGEVITADGASRARAHGQGDRVDRHDDRSVGRSRRPRPGSRRRRYHGGPVSEATNFLYPFIESDERDAGALLARSERVRTRQGAGQRRAPPGDPRAVSGHDRAGAAAMGERFAQGGRLFVFGNGGSSTDAASLAALFVQPPWGQPLPARDLVDDSAVLTALGNDVGFDLVFSRQLIAHAQRG